jgi:hypothetical protein
MLLLLLLELLPQALAAKVIAPIAASSFHVLAMARFLHKRRVETNEGPQPTRAAYKKPVTMHACLTRTRVNAVPLLVFL